MVIFLRILLLLLPIVLLITWLRWRAKKNAEGEIPEAEVKRLRMTLVGIVLAIIGAGIGLKYADDSGAVDGVYVPARVEDGKLIPGYFKKEESSEETDKSSGSNEN